MKIAKFNQSLRWRLTAAFLVVACFVGAFVGIAIAIQLTTVEKAAQLEAAHVAELIGDAAIEADGDRVKLQEYIERLSSLRRRDVVVVDTARQGLADADPKEVGQFYRHDPGGEVAKTIADGQTRIFVEKNEAHPDGARQVVIPLRQGPPGSSKPIVGAIILEYTPILEDLNAVERERLYLTGAIGLLVVVLVTLFGFDMAGRIARPLRNLKRSAEHIAAGQYGSRVVVASQDEIGLLSAAFNRMAEDLGASHARLLENKRDLERNVASRTQELDEANALLREEVRHHQTAAQRAEYLAYYDGLTGLPNRSMFSKLLNQALSLARRSGKQLAVLFVDLDRFKNINDTLGHEAGDMLLQEVGRRLQGCLRESDTVARLGGDEFVILLPSMEDAARVEAVAHKVLAAISRSFVAHGQEFRVTASVGVSCYPKDGVDEQSLTKNADIAMYQAKAEGKNNFQFYSEQMNTHSFERLALESSLRRALELNEFHLHYQPKIDARTGGIAGMEALIRWQHPELGLVGPTKFIAIAEETGLIVPIGKWVLRTACAQNVSWQQEGLPRLSMAVNLSGRQFLDEDLLRDVTTILEETGMSPSLLELEITESTLMHDVDKAMLTLQAFKDMDVRLAIDDFGTGYSSLYNLKQFPVDTIKIDGSFIRELSDNPESRGIAEAIIAMGRTLSLTVVAEGVETKAQADFLREKTCDEFQGFYFSKAVPPGQISELLEAQLHLQ